MQEATMEAGELLDEHINYVIERLDKDMRLIISLSALLGALSYRAQIIEGHLLTCKPKNDKARRSFNKSSAWTWSSNIARVERSLDQYELDQQRGYLDRMTPKIEAARIFLSNATNEFGAALGACHNFRERLRMEMDAVKKGERSAWIIKQIILIEQGVYVLKFELQNFKELGMKFDDSVFHQELAKKLRAINA